MQNEKLEQHTKLKKIPRILHFSQHLIKYWRNFHAKRVQSFALWCCSKNAAIRFVRTHWTNPREKSPKRVQLNQEIQSQKLIFPKKRNIDVYSIINSCNLSESKETLFSFAVVIPFWTHIVFQKANHFSSHMLSLFFGAFLWSSLIMPEPPSPSINVIHVPISLWKRVSVRSMVGGEAVAVWLYQTIFQTLTLNYWLITAVNVKSLDQI